MDDIYRQDPDKGADNLLINCAGVHAGDRLLIVHEDPALGWYDREAPQAVAARARKLGLAVTMLEVQGPSQTGALPPEILDAIAAHDQTIFFARLGDQNRFSPGGAAKPAIMSYALDAEMLGSAYGHFPYAAFVDLKDALNDTMDSAAEIHIGCPNGTDLSGHPVIAPAKAVDVTIKRFPMGIYKPVMAAGFSGKVALTRHLTPTGSRSYSPASIPLRDTVWAYMDGNRINSFEGTPATVSAVEEHYSRIAEKFGIDPMYVDSWHSGLHPACRYAAAADDNPDRWSNSAFPNPRILHFHTCGAYSPGEICWMVFDPVITLDGKALWEAGHLDRGFNAHIISVFEKWPDLQLLFDYPARQIGF